MVPFASEEHNSFVFILKVNGLENFYKAEEVVGIFFLMHDIYRNEIALWLILSVGVIHKMLLLLMHPVSISKILVIDVARLTISLICIVLTRLLMLLLFVAICCR